MRIRELLQQMYDLPRSVTPKVFQPLLLKITSHPDYPTIKAEFEKSYTKESGWLFVGADYSSLEDRINALLTKDTNKLRVYTDGFDGHSLRAYSYWGDQMPDIQQATNEKCYMVDGVSFKESDTINYQGRKYTGQQFYDLFN